MTDKRKDRFQQAATDINLNLGTLLGTLGEAVSEIVNRLDDGKSGEVMREHVFDTEKGPVRAQAGIRLRMGGLDTSEPRPTPQPVNRPRRNAPPPSAPRGFDFDLFEEDDLWVLTADLPGATASEVVLEDDGEALNITTTGQRKYAQRVVLAGSFDASRTKVSLHNGILELQIPKDNQT